MSVRFKSTVGEIVGMKLADLYSLAPSVVLDGQRSPDASYRHDKTSPEIREIIHSPDNFKTVASAK